MSHYSTSKQMWQKKQKRNYNAQNQNQQISAEMKYENSRPNNSNNNDNNIRYLNGTKPAFNLGAGDSYYIPSFLDRNISDSSFISLMNGDEIKWYQTYIYQNNKMIPQKRLSNTQIQINDNNNNIIPLYRYPTNNLQSMPIITHYTKSVQSIINAVENELCQSINHAVIAIYRNGRDHIGFHSDKMLDICRNSKIASISLGTKRKFILKQLNEFGNKEDHIMLHHGSLIVIGPETNKYFRHSVIKDNKINTPRISLSLRYIATFWNQNKNRNKNKNNIFGQGSEYQSLNYPLKPFNEHNINPKIHFVDYKYNELNKFINNISIHCDGSYKYNIDKDEYLQKYKISEICYTRKDSHFRCILFKNINNKSIGYQILKYLKKEKYTNCIHIPFAMIVNDKIYEYDNDNEPKRAKIGEYLLNVLKQNNKNNKNDGNMMIVVIRHWLGTLLGINNLFNCYQIVSQSLFKSINMNNINDDENVNMSQSTDWKQKYFALKEEYDKLKAENNRLKSQINSNRSTNK